MADLECPSCGEDTNLRGHKTNTGIRVLCSTCGLEWDRGTRHRCATCGGEDIATRPQTLTAFSRGNQLSILGWHEVPMCGACDREELLRSTQEAAPLPPDYRPAAMERKRKPR
ncbi:hypothetical protein DXT87_09990 [Arthrobacter sp. AET 35A]|nr:hypothetical protein [Arthrobacter sp. AET 35A]